MPNVNEVKKMGIAGVLLCSAMLVIAPAMAQDTPPPPPAQGDAQGPPPGGRGGGMMNPERRLEMMQKQLGLSPEQSTAIKSILDDEQTKMQAMRSDTSMSRDDRRSKMMAMRDDEKTKVEAVLTKDQKVKYEDMEAKMRERTQRGGGDGPPPPPPPQ